MNYKKRVVMSTRAKKIQWLAGAFIIAVFSFTHAVAQTGIGTLNPANNSSIVTTGGNVVIDNTGKLGVLVANPITAIDLRSGTNGSFAVGMTDQTASEAGAGALRYNPNPAIGVKGYMEYSDGTNWLGFFPFGKPRIVVMAEKTTQNTYVFETGAVAIGAYTTGMPPRSSAYLTHWTEKLDSDSGTPTNNFDPATGEFIAPRAGVYFATFTFALADNNVNTGGNNQTEAIWEVRNPGGTITQRVKTNNGYPSDTGSGPTNVVKVGSACTVSVYLNQGDKLRPFSWVSVSFGTDMRLFDVSGGYNVLTIVEQ
ncbi:hypothetical protein DU508_11020 [Pedobacter chinensis]|uniref:C1q domain-containing protein n=1 Tax=Pedobacter chinensis TaxID=2282421 RepID=A0A369PUE1_9SPHI|nr:hypothetical protein [Pedobacter chinensis]RDC56144.1 hypothetical protein DU508_11020 [Pedobacter chinensis]